MIMKKSFVFFVGLTAIVLASAAFTLGQEKTATFEREVPAQGGLTFQGPEGQGNGVNTFTFVNSEFSFDKLVKGAPYSAKAVTEMTQTLSDGNRIVNTSSAAVYRDGEGRTRREQTLKTIGNFSAHGEPFQTISINDPVTGVAYVLEPHSHTARKIQGLRIDSESRAGFRISSPSGEGEALTLNSTTSGPVTVRLATSEAKMNEERERTNFRKEDLGTQTVEGVNAVGTKHIITIPAGQIGNERAIEIVEEQWYSPELQTMVMTRHSDPRSGETVYRLTNIDRTEPDRSLFQVPPDYTVREQEPMRFRLDKPKPEQEW
jgi:hypothetical protein